MKNNLIVAAAMLGMIGAASAIGASAHAGDPTGHCMGASSCKGHGDCKSDANTCKGQNGCKGQGWKAMTEKKCNKVAKKSKDAEHPVKWMAADKAADNKG